MFIHVDEEKANTLTQQWSKAREILRNNNNFCYEDMIDRIEQLSDQLHDNNDKMSIIKEYVNDKFICPKYNKQTLVNKFRNNMFAILV
jgi:hypothetical protein